MGKPKDEPRRSWADVEDPAAKKARAQKVLARLDKAYPQTKTALDHTNAFELLIATVLSAQSTDKGVNILTKTLFEKYRAPEDYLAAKPGELEADIRPSGYFNQKSRAIKGICKMLVEEFDGEVPRTMEELTRLPGVARKTANVVLANAYGINVGIAVDTHVHRLSWRLAFSDHSDVVKVERDLMALFPKSKWFKVTHLLIDHGRAICLARAPQCADCPVNTMCPASRLPDEASATRRARTRGSRGSA